MRNRFLLTAAGALLALAAQAHDYRVGGLHLVHPNTPQPAPGQEAAGVYLVIENTSAASDRLLSASSERAGNAVLHLPAVAGAGMHAAPALEIPPASRVELSLQGPHIMLGGFERPLKAGERFPLRLVFERAGAVQVEVTVGSGAPPKVQEAHRGH